MWLEESCNLKKENNIFMANMKKNPFDNGWKEALKELGQELLKQALKILINWLSNQKTRANATKEVQAPKRQEKKP